MTPATAAKLPATAMGMGMGVSPTRLVIRKTVRCDGGVDMSSLLPKEIDLGLKGCDLFCL